MNNEIDLSESEDIDIDNEIEYLKNNY